MPLKTAAPWEIPYINEATDEPKVYPTTSKEIAEHIAELFGEHVLTITKHAAAYEAKSGELGVQEKASETTTLPLAATKDQLIAVTCKASSCKVTTSGGAFIYGKWLTLASKTATVTLTENMTAFFHADGTNWILTGEVKSEQAYVAERAFIKAEGEAGIELSSTRPAMVLAELEPGELKIGGIKVANWGSGLKVFSFYVPAGVKWTTPTAGFFSYVLL